MDKEKIDDDLTFRVIGCAMKVHSTLGNGFKEIFYQKALAIELRNAGIKFKSEVEMPVYYEGELLGVRRVDFLVEDIVVLELKAVSIFEPSHLAQGLNYLVAYNVDKGLLINFGGTSLDVKRLRHPRNKTRY